MSARGWDPVKGEAHVYVEVPCRICGGIVGKLQFTPQPGIRVIVDDLRQALRAALQVIEATHQRCAEEARR